MTTSYFGWDLESYVTHDIIFFQSESESIFLQNGQVHCLFRVLAQLISVIFCENSAGLLIINNNSTNSPKNNKNYKYE
jgi:hypothetical protein